MDIHVLLVLYAGMSGVLRRQVLCVAAVVLCFSALAPQIFMDNLVEPSVPQSSSDECPFPSRRTQVGIIAALRLRTGLTASTPSSPLLRPRSAERRLVRRVRLHSDDAESGDPDDARASDEDSDGGSSGGLYQDSGDGDQVRDAGPAHADVGDQAEADLDDVQGDVDEAPTPEVHPRRRPGLTRSAGGKPAKRQRTILGGGASVGATFGTLQQRRAAVNAERRTAVQGILRTWLRATAGLMTAAADSFQGGLCGRVVTAPDCRSRVVFCRVGPAAVDMVSLWLSPSGRVLFSCRDHTENVALASSTGRGSSCWHAHAFNVALRDLMPQRAAIVESLQVKPEAEPHSSTF